MCIRYFSYYNIGVIHMHACTCQATRLHCWAVKKHCSSAASCCHKLMVGYTSLLLSSSFIHIFFIYRTAPNVVAAQDQKQTRDN